MKKSLFILTFLSHLLSAQNAELFSNTWYISQIVTNGQNVTTPAMAYSISASTFSQNGSEYIFNSKYFNTATSNITFSPTLSNFTKNGGGCTLADYWGTNMTAVQGFDQKNCNFYVGNPSLPVPAGTLYNYQIINNGSSKTLIITNPTTGTQIFYNNSILGTNEDLLKNNFRMFPNPSKDFLIVEHIERNLNLKIYETSGKLVYETLTSKKSIRIDVSHFQKGQYILMIENLKPEFFIKD
ncbi:T9SS type A sorting domain-containing protein [Chryseobacterium wangxinyae]|uniref:T9SS type A sorting domain-containing protein n=1 Tax=Chryseobacterium sp. CY353 TaxID=2997334 RepID=UPI00226EE68D|nr:T9SS type A sorting domain-containing protein [Chryseobacterium sp. CY353]MCY0968505.1 T9SS type A sorting domain-containing protein [Chryseobacterium sp. CY353]